MTRTRLVRLSDAPVLASLLARNREFLAPTSPGRPDEFFTVDGQRAGIQAGLAEGPSPSKTARPPASVGSTDSEDDR